MPHWVSVVVDLYSSSIIITLLRFITWFCGTENIPRNIPHIHTESSSDVMISSCITLEYFKLPPPSSVVAVYQDRCACRPLKTIDHRSLTATILDLVVKILTTPRSSPFHLTASRGFLLVYYTSLVYPVRQIWLQQGALIERNVSRSIFQNFSLVTKIHATASGSASEKYYLDESSFGMHTETKLLKSTAVVLCAGRNDIDWVVVLDLFELKR